MTRDEIRLELVKLTHRHDKTPEENVGRAKELEKYVFEVEGTGDEDSSPVSAMTKRPKKAGNVDPLS